MATAVKAMDTKDHTIAHMEPMTNRIECRCGLSFAAMGAFTRHVDEELKPRPVTQEQVIQQTLAPPRTTADFFALIEDSLGTHAARKGYSDNGADGENLLYKFTHSIGVSAGHSMGEIIYKAVEYMKDPREVLLVKIASWCLLEYRYGTYSSGK